MARPKGSHKPIDLVKLEQYAKVGCTQLEMARVLGVSPDTLERRLQKKEVRDVLNHAQAELYTSLRSKQVQLALAGNVTMLIWLGKQYLGQKEEQVISGVGPGGRIEIGASTAAQRIAARIDSVAAQIEAAGDPEGDQ